MLRWGRTALVYLGATALSGTIAHLSRGGSPFVYPTPWLALPSPANHAYSLAIGLAFGTLIAVSTRGLVSRFAWARNLHRELRPVARDMTGFGILLVAITSGVAEELFFRGLLAPWIGLWLQALIFGLLHAQLKGPSRWVWVAWATLMGLTLGALFELTGSLAGPIAAHALINGLNLDYLKSHDTDPSRRALGGLLGQRS